MACIAVVCIVFFLVILALQSHKSSYSIFVDVVPYKCGKKEQDDLDKQEYERWVKKANPALDAFVKEFKFVTSESYHDDLKAEDILAACERCVDLWYAYWGTQEDVHVWVHAKEHMKNYIGTAFEPCMMDGIALKKRLYSAAEYKKLSNEQRMMICTEILRIVLEKQSCMRCKLLKMDICNATYEQIDSCYQHLLLKNKLVECKNGNRYYVSMK